MKTIFAMALLAAFAVNAETTDYVADRAIYETCPWGDWINFDPDLAAQCFLEDTVNVGGTLVVTDGGPYTPIESVDVDAGACPEGQPYVPGNETCVSLVGMVEMASYTEGGRVYYGTNGQSYHIIRRGSEETGDASFLVLTPDGTTWMFKQVLD